MIGHPMREILELARWAPSGDNTQPWRFEPVSAMHVRVHGFDTRDHCVYDLDGRPSRLSVGALLETVGIAASLHGLTARIVRDVSAPETMPIFDVFLESAPGLAPDVLADAITSRCVQRRAMSARPLASDEKRSLELAVGPLHEVIWFEGFARRWQMASLMFRSARIRLTTEEAYRVHAAVIEWRSTRSVDRMPDAAIGLDPISLAAMRVLMRSWPLTRFVSLHLGGTLAPRLQLDLLPGLWCAAHVAIVRREAVAPARMLDADFDDGRAVQRFWLTAEKLGLRHQPEMTPLVFSRYAAEGRRFTQYEPAIALAGDVRRRLESVLGVGLRERTVWLGRIGAGRRATARSTRLPLDDLLVSRTSSGSPS